MPDNSEVATKTKGRVGRPRLLDAETRARIVAQFNVRTERAIQEHWYRLRAMSVLFDAGMDKCWLMDIETMAAGGPAGERAWRPQLLSALGRITDDGELIARAQDLCERRPSIKAGLATLRCPVEPQRNDALPVHTAAKLSRAIERAINEYRCEHDGVVDADISRALWEQAERITWPELEAA